MKKEDLRIYRDQKIKIFLKNSTFFTGYIQELGEDSFLLLDKFNSNVRIAYSEISHILEAGENHG